MTHVVIVDDEEIIRGLVEQIVTTMGWTYDSAVNGFQAQELIQRVVPDLVIADVVMPGMNGIELIGALKQDPDLSQIPVVIMSSIDRKAEAREAECAAFIAKPFSLATMIQVLSQVAPSQGPG